MTIQQIRKALLLVIGGFFVWWAWRSPAQDVSSANASQQMPYSVNQVLELEQAKIGDATIIAYIKSSGTSFNLNAAQIVYLRQQGLSDAVITAMLTQPHASVAAPSVPAEQQAAAATSAATTSDPAIISQPSVTYVQTAPASYYPAPYYYGYSYPYYGYFGWPFGRAWYGGAWHGGWIGWHGGWGGGWHGGGGWRR